MNDHDIRKADKEKLAALFDFALEESNEAEDAEENPQAPVAREPNSELEKAKPAEG